MTLPKGFRCGPYDYTIAYGIPLDGACGHFQKDSGQIVIQQGLQLQREKETVSHEVDHACWEVAALPSEESDCGKLSEEEVITRLNTVRYDTLTRKENKVLRVYLFGD